MIHIEALHKEFQDGAQRHVVLHDLSLRIPTGAFVALLGRSGSGKSTLLNCIAGIEEADSGGILFDGIDMSRLSDRERTRLRRDRIGIIFQFFNLLPTLPVLENIALPALLRGDAQDDAFARAHDLLEELELGDRAAQMPEQLSGGEQQRVATARALINGPQLLLADEPTGNLDAATAASTLQLLRQVNERHGVTILMVTHSREAAGIAQVTATLQDGKVDPPDLSDLASAAAAAEHATRPNGKTEENANGEAPDVVESAVEEIIREQDGDAKPSETEQSTEPSTEAPAEPSDEASAEAPAQPEAVKVKASAKAQALLQAQGPTSQEIDQILQEIEVEGAGPEESPTADAVPGETEAALEEPPAATEEPETEGEQPQAAPARPQAEPARPQAAPPQPQAAPAQPQAEPARPQAAPDPPEG